DLDRVCVPCLDRVGQAAQLTLVALDPRRPLEAARAAVAARASRAAGLLRGFRDAYDVPDGLLRRVPERRRPEQGNDERCGGKCDGEALQGAFEASTVPGCWLPDRERHANRGLDLLPARLDRSADRALCEPDGIVVRSGLGIVLRDRGHAA